MSGNWIFTATRAGLFVGEFDADRIAVCTWPIEAAAKGRWSKDVKYVDHFGPKEVARTF
jgi:hypothetical protein